METEHQDKEQEGAVSAKKRNADERKRREKEKKAEELEKKKKLEAEAAAVAAAAAAVAAEEKARVDAKAAAVAEIEAQRLAVIAAKKQKKKKTNGEDDFALLEEAIAANDNTEAGSDATATVESERDAQLREKLAARMKLTEKSRKKDKKKPDAAAPSTEEKAKADALAAAAEATKARRLEAERDAMQKNLLLDAEREARRLAAKKKPQPIAALVAEVPVAAPPQDPAEQLRTLDLELVALEAEAQQDVSRSLLSDRVTELMIKLDVVPVASTELRALRKNAIARLESLSARLGDCAS